MSTANEYTPEMIQALVLGELDPQVAEQIRTAALSDKALAAEIAICEAVREISAEAAAQAAPGEFGWARIEKAIAAKEATNVANDNSGSGSKPVWLRQVIAPWQAAAAIAVAVLGWQVAIVPAITTTAGDSEPAYELASGDKDAQFTLRIAFDETATEAEMRAALREVEARIVDGPSAIGLYTVSFEDAQSMEDAAQKLGEQTDIVAEVAE